MATTSVTEPAPAKLNLDLYVEGRRPDGYHLLDSVVAFTAFGDDLALAPAAAFDLTVDGPFAAALRAAGESLVTAAVHRLAAALDRRPAVAVRLTKRIPLAAGLGGGSADAAAALRALARLWGDAETSLLVEIARGLGADVPACLAGRPARLTGVGDVLAPAPAIPPLELVLVNPDRPAPTGAVYRALDPAGFAPAPARRETAGAGLPAWLRDGRNDLEAAALAIAPAIGAVRDRLAASGAAVVRLSGSGATVFAVYADAAAADAAAAALRAERPQWWIERTRTT